MPSPALIALPELWLVGCSLVLLVWGAWQKTPSALFYGASVAALVVAAVITCVGPLGQAFGGSVVEDRFAVFSKVVIYLATALAIPLGQSWFKRRGIDRFEYPILIIIAGLGMGVMVSARDLIGLYIGIELHSLALYVLAAFENNLPSNSPAQRDAGKSSEAGLKYFVLGALSSGILLYGASLVYGFAGSTRFADIAVAMGHGAGHGGALFGLVFLICGIGFKVSAAPFHMWTPDVYEGAPTPVVGFFAGAPKLAAMVLLARLLSEAFGGAVGEWRQVLIAMALISVGVGAFAGLAQNDLKRLWAYSSIANIGYALAGLAAGGTAGVQSMLVFMTLYVVDITGFFACLAALSRNGRPMQSFDDLAGLARERPGMAIAMTFFSLSALGMPPFSGLWSKYYVFKAALASGLGWVAVLALIGSVVAAFYYLKLIRRMWFDAAPGPTDPLARGASVVAYAAAAFSFPGVLIALIAIDPLALSAARSVVAPTRTVDVLVASAGESPRHPIALTRDLSTRTSTVR